ncbi:MAG: hypothetical protein QQN41_11350 [Nitrosopumilus sp.]
MTKLKRVLLLIPILLFLTSCGFFENAVEPVNETSENLTQATVINLTNSTEENTTELSIIVIEENVFLPPKGKNLSLYILDVGGYSSIVFKEQTSLLIDSGLEADAQVILKRLRNLGITKLDYVIVSNVKEENVGGIPYIIIQTSPTKIYESGITSLSSNYKLFKELYPNSTKVDMDKLFLMKGFFVKLMVIYDDGGGFSQNPEDNSIVTKISYNENRFLFMSNCGFPCLERIIDHDVNANVIVIDGSCDSTTLTFLQRVTPDIAIITGEICEETKSGFNFLNVPMFSLVEHGDIKIESDGKNFNLKYLKMRP